MYNSVKARTTQTVMAKIIYTVMSWCLLVRNIRAAEVAPKVGIIGGGIGGTATAYFLQELFNNNVALDLYERGSIGGRLALSKDFDREYEMGGAIIHPQNLYMNQFIEDLGLQRKGQCPSKFGIFNGEIYAFVESSWKFINIAKFIWRYGFDVIRLHGGVDEILENFSKIYKHQSDGTAYKTVKDLLSSMDPSFPSLLQMPYREYLKKEHGISGLIVDEMVTAVTRVNYGQLSDIHAFVGSVAMAGANPDLWSVLGGNKRVAEELLKASNANTVKKLVTKISPTEDGKFMVYSQSMDSEGDEGSSSEASSEEDYAIYDAVAIAAPMTRDNSHLKLINFSNPIEFYGSYQRIICTMVQGYINKTTFRYKETGQKVDDILTFPASLFYNSVGLQSSIFVTREKDCGNSVPVHKVFSPEPLSNEQLSELFETYDKIEVVDWLAYPHYTSHEILDDFELVPGLYYNNAIEKAASAMEMSAIAAKNVALLIYQYLAKDSFPPSSQDGERKDEL